MPLFPCDRISRWDVAPAVDTAPDREPLHCLLSLDESPRQVGIGDADSSWDQASDHVRAVRALRAGGRYPHLDAVVQHGGNVVHADKRSFGDEIAKARLQVKPTRFGAAQSGDQRSVGVALPHFLDGARTEAAAIEECIPAFLLGDAGDRLVLGGERGKVVRLALSASESFVCGQLRPSFAST